MSHEHHHEESPRGCPEEGRSYARAMWPNVSFQMTSLFLMAYMTDIAGLSAAVAGTIYGVTKVWAGVTDLLAGNTVGRKDTKWGRLRPWIVGVSPFLSISLVAMFSTPAGLSPTATVAWILLFDAAFQLCYSFVNIPYGSLSSAMTEDSTDRSRLSGARSIASAVTGVLLAFVVAPQFENTAADGIRLRFTIAAILLSVAALVLYWICFRGTREVVPLSPGKLTLSSTLKMVRQNKPLLVLCAAALFLLGAGFTMNAVMLYYARDVLGSAGSFTWLYLAQTIGTIAVASLVPAITSGSASDRIRGPRRRRRPRGRDRRPSARGGQPGAGSGRLPHLRRRFRRHQRPDVLAAGRHRRLRRVEDGHPRRGRQLLHPVVRPQVRPGHRRLRRWGGHRRLRVRRRVGVPVARGDPGNQGRRRMVRPTLHNRRAVLLRYPLGPRSTQITPSSASVAPGARSAAADVAHGAGRWAHTVSRRLPSGRTVNEQYGAAGPRWPSRSPRDGGPLCRHPFSSEDLGGPRPPSRRAPPPTVRCRTSRSFLRTPNDVDASIRRTPDRQRARHATSRTSSTGSRTPAA